MKNDYLWDKTGDDPEIKRFEEILAVYRHTETAPPLFAAEIAAPAMEPARRWRLSFSFAFAAAAFAAIVVAIGISLIAPRSGGGETAKNPGSISTPTIESDIAGPVDENHNVTTVPEKTAVPSHAPERQTANPLRTALRSRRQPALPSKQSIAGQRYDALTGDEKYAYGQLMLALSITGSKLKVVQDTIDRIEDPKVKITDKNR